MRYFTKKSFILFLITISVLCETLGGVSHAETTPIWFEANTEAENLMVYEIPERVPGSFFTEAEEGTLTDMNIGTGEDASDGKYIAAREGKEVLAPMSSAVIYARYKFKITQPGKYKIFIRYFTPKPRLKSTWVGIDNTEYYWMETTQTERWQWYSSADDVGTQGIKSPYLREGYHTLDIIPRQGGQMLDSIIITNDMNFTPQGLGSLPGEKVRPDAFLRERQKFTDFMVNGKPYKSDAPFIKENGEILVPANNILNAIGIKLENYDEYFLAVRDGQYLKFYPESKKAVISGKTVELKASTVMSGGVIPMAPISLISEAFGLQYRIEEDEHLMYVTDDYQENYRDGKENEILFETGKFDVNFAVPCSNPDARVDVWVKVNDREEYWKDFGSFIENWTTYYKGNRDNSALFYWRKAYKPVYENGMFKGSFGDLIEQHYYDVKVRIAQGTDEDIFVIRNAFKTEKTERISLEDTVYKTERKILLKPTFENIGYYLDVIDSNAKCSFKYREKGTEEWKEVYGSYYNKDVKQYMGSIVGLKPDTEYEVMAEIDDDRDSDKFKFASVKTWSENPPIAKTIKLKDIYKNGTLNLQGIKGSADGWIKIEGEGMTVDGGKNNMDAVYISDCRYLIFDNVKVTGGYRYGVHICANSNDIRIQNYDISGWSRKGLLDSSLGVYMMDGNPLNLEGGIRISDASNVVVERCYIHDSNGTTNSWNGKGWSNIHPCGFSGIVCRAVEGLVIRYNDIIGGNDENRWNDAIECIYNDYRESGLGRDADIYGNFLGFAQDDCIEVDGGGMNVRIYQNRMEQSLCGISTAPLMTGPTYIFRNLITNLGNSEGSVGSAIKMGGSTDSINGLQYILNNTFVLNGRGMGNYGRNINGSRSESHMVSRNNVIATKGFMSIEGAIVPDERDSCDYDMVSGSTSAWIKEEHGISGEPQFRNESEYDFTLIGDGVNKGEDLGNFCSEKIDEPDMGAFENGRNTILPYRPINISADKSCVNITDKKSGIVTVSARDIAGCGYEIVKNDNFKWLDIKLKNNKNKTIGAGETVQFEISCNTDLLGEQTKIQGAVMFRLDNGFSIPITVKYEKESE